MSGVTLDPGRVHNILVSPTQTGLTAVDCVMKAASAVFGRLRHSVFGRQQPALPIVEEGSFGGKQFSQP